MPVFDYNRLHDVKTPTFLVNLVTTTIKTILNHQLYILLITKYINIKNIYGYNNTYIKNIQ